jgi:VCBS repeat-containing protein
MRNSVGSIFTKRLVFESLEPRLLLSADPLGAAESLAASSILEFNAPINAEASSYTLRFNADSGDLEVLEGGTVVASRALGETTAVVINGEDWQDDALTVDFGFGGFFSLEDGIEFNGGADGIDLLRVVGGEFESVTHTATSSGPGRSGSLAYDDGTHPALAIDYTDLEPIDLSASGITSLVINLPGLDDQAILEDDGVAGNGLSIIRSQNANPTFESTLFSNSVTSLTVTMGADNGAFTVAALPDYLNRSLTVDGGAGADTVTFQDSHAFSSLTVITGGSISAASLALGGASFISSGTFIVDSLSATAGTTTVNAQTTAGALAISGGATVNLNAASSVGSLSVAGGGTAGNVGGLGGSGNVTLLAGGAHSWTSGVLSGGGTLTVAGDATLTVSGTNHTLTSKSISNNGRIHWVGGTIDVNGSTSLVNGGEFELAANSTLGNVFAPNGTMVLINSGLILQQEAETTIFGPGVTVNNQGRIRIDAGTVSFGNGGTHTGSFDAAAGATLAFSGGTHNFNPGSSVTVAGTLAVSAGTVNLDTEANLSGAIAQTGGIFNLTPVSGVINPARISVSGSGAVLNLTAVDAISTASVTIANAGTANLNSATQIGALSVTGGGTAGGAGGLGGTGAVTLLAGGAHAWNSGNLSGSGTLTVAARATLAIAGGDHFLNSKPIVNDGQVRWTGGVIDVNGSNTFANRGELDMAANSVLGNQFAPNGTLTLTNTGVIRQLAGTTTLTRDVTLVNTGLIDVAAGSVLLRTGGFTSAGRLSGGGTIDVGSGVLINTGTVAPDGTLTVLGNYSQGTEGHLEIGISPTEVDSLAVIGAATVADTATLRVAYEGGFRPGAGERFRVMSFASLDGSFGSTDLPQGALIETSPTRLDLVPPANTAPQAADDNFATAEDTPLEVAAPGVLGNDSDADQDALSAILQTGPAHGALTFHADGSFEYRPDENFFGEDSFTYSVSDGSFESGLATVLLVVTGANDRPVAGADLYSVDEDGTLGVPAAGVLANDTDADGDALSATQESGPANGSLEFSADGSFTYRPNANFFGTDTFAYRAGDGTAASEVTTVTIQVTAVNDAPVAAADSFQVDGTLTVGAPGVLANDSDVDGSALTAKLVSSTANGVLVFNENGSFTYTPNAGFSGSDSFTYRASDGELDSDPVTVTLEVLAQNENHAPVVDAGPDLVVGLQDVDDGHGKWWRWHWNGDRPEADVTLNAIFDDLDLDDTHTATINWGDGKVSAGRVLEPTDTDDGAVQGGHTYTTAGTYTVTVTVRDSEGNETSDTLKVTVRNPIEKRNFDANGDDYRLNEDTVLTVNAAHGVLDNDRGPLGAALAVRLVEGADHGSLVLNADGSFVYTPDKDFHGQDSFWYEFTDGANVSRAVEVELCVKDVPERPRPCIDWGNHWKTPWNDCFQPFGKRWR